MAAGKVWLVGAGPGDIGLFTLKGEAVLQQADVVVYDSLVGEGVLARIPEHARLINVGKRASHHTMVQEDINKVLLEEAQKGNKVVRLKGGDIGVVVQKTVTSNQVVEHIKVSFEDASDG